MQPRDPLVEDTDFLFDTIVSIVLEGNSIAIGDAVAAKACFLDNFPDHDAPSYRWAVETCEAFLSGKGTASGAQASFIVAAMEAGIPFEVQDIGLDLLAAQLGAQVGE